MLDDPSPERQVAFADRVLKRLRPDLRIRQDRGVIVLAIKREAGMRFNPSPDDRIEPGDFLIAMGEPQQIRELERKAGSSL